MQPVAQDPHMRTDISNPKIGVGQSTVSNAPKIVFLPHRGNATFSRPPHPPLNHGKIHREAGLRASNQPSTLRGGCGGQPSALASCHLFRCKKYAIFARFFRDRLVNVRESPQPFFLQNFWRRFSATGRSREIFYFRI